MEQKSATETMIKQAKELQRLGLCQGAREWIWLGDYKGHAEHLLSSKESPPEVLYELLGYRVNWERIGPLATASECWPEIKKRLGDYTIEIDEDELRIIETAQEYPDVFKVTITEIWSVKFDDLDQAFRQALIELTKDTK